MELEKKAVNPEPHQRQRAVDPENQRQKAVDLEDQRQRAVDPEDQRQRAVDPEDQRQRAVESQREKATDSDSGTFSARNSVSSSTMSPCSSLSRFSSGDLDASRLRFGGMNCGFLSVKQDSQTSWDLTMAQIKASKQSCFDSEFVPYDFKRIFLDYDSGKFALESLRYEDHSLFLCADSDSYKVTIEKASTKESRTWWRSPYVCKPSVCPHSQRMILQYWGNDYQCDNGLYLIIEGGPDKYNFHLGRKACACSFGVFVWQSKHY